MSEKLIFHTEDGETELYVIEQTRLNGADYLLVAESDDDEAECMILKDVTAPEEKEACYEPVEDEELLDALVKIFAELLPEDMEIGKA